MRKMNGEWSFATKELNNCCSQQMLLLINTHNERSCIENSTPYLTRSGTLRVEVLEGIIVVARILQAFHSISFAPLTLTTNKILS